MKEKILNTLYLIFFAIMCALAFLAGMQLRIEKWYNDKAKRESEIEVVTMTTEAYTETTTDEEIVDCLIPMMPVSYVKEETYENEN